PEDEETEESDETAETLATEETDDEAAEPTAEDDEADSDGEIPQGGTIVLMGHHSIDSLSPDDVGRTVEWVSITQIHNAMLELDPWYVLQPTLAESFDVS